MLARGRKGARTSSQDRSIGRYGVPLHTAKRRKITNSKIKNNQNCQKIELYGNLTKKQVRKHSSRLVGGAETGNWGGKDAKLGVRWRIWVGEVVAGRSGTSTFMCR